MGRPEHVQLPATESDHCSLQLGWLAAALRYFANLLPIRISFRVVVEEGLINSR